MPLASNSGRGDAADKAALLLQHLSNPDYVPDADVVTAWRTSVRWSLAVRDCPRAVVGALVLKAVRCLWSCGAVLGRLCVLIVQYMVVGVYERWHR